MSLGWAWVSGHVIVVEVGRSSKEAWIGYDYKVEELGEGYND
jgi:hypothetical protein